MTAPLPPISVDRNPDDMLRCPECNAGTLKACPIPAPDPDGPRYDWRMFYCHSVLYADGHLQQAKPCKRAVDRASLASAERVVGNGD